MVMLRSSSFLKRTVWTPEMALTTVDLPWATWPMVPINMWRMGVGLDYWNTAREGREREERGEQRETSTTGTYQC